MSSKSEIWDWFYPRKNVLFWKKANKWKVNEARNKTTFPFGIFCPKFSHPSTYVKWGICRFIVPQHTIQRFLPLYSAVGFFFEKFDPRSQSRMRCYGWRYFSLSTLTYGLQFLIWWHHSSFPFLDGKHEELFAELHTDQEATLFIRSNANKTKIKTSFMWR